MPKCPKCGKKFNSIQALNDHFHSIHPNDKFVPSKQPSSARTLMVIIIIVIIAMGSLVQFLIYSQIHTTTTSTSNLPCVSCIGEAVSPALYQNLAGISSSTLNTIGSQPTSVATKPGSDYRFGFNKRWQARSVVYWRRVLPILCGGEVGNNYCTFEIWNFFESFADARVYRPSRS